MSDTYRLVLRKNSSTGKVLGTKGPYSSQAKAIAAAESLRKKVGKGDFISVEKQRLHAAEEAAIARHEEEAYGRAERSHKGNPRKYRTSRERHNWEVVIAFTDDAPYSSKRGDRHAWRLKIEAKSQEEAEEKARRDVQIDPSLKDLEIISATPIERSNPDSAWSDAPHGKTHEKRPSNVPPERWQRWIDEEEALRAKYPKTKQAFIDEYVRVTGEFYRAQHKSKKWLRLNKVLGEMWDAQNRWAPEGELRGDIEEAKYRLEKAARQWDNAAEIKQLKERLRDLESELRELEKRGGVPRLRNNPFPGSRRYRYAYMEKENEPWTDPDFPWALMVYDPATKTHPARQSVVWYYGSEDAAAEDIAEARRMISHKLPTIEIQRYITRRSNPSEAECDARVRRALEGGRKKHRKAPTWTTPEDFPPLPTGARVNPVFKKKHARKWIKQIDGSYYWGSPEISYLATKEWMAGDRGGKKPMWVLYVIDKRYDSPNRGVWTRLGYYRLLRDAQHIDGVTKEPADYYGKWSHGDFSPKSNPKRKPVWVLEKARHPSGRTSIPGGYVARNVKTGAEVWGANIGLFRDRDWRKRHGLPDYIGKEADHVYMHHGGWRWGRGHNNPKSNPKPPLTPTERHVVELFGMGWVDRGDGSGEPAIDLLERAGHWNEFGILDSLQAKGYIHIENPDFGEPTVYPPRLPGGR